MQERESSREDKRQGQRDGTHTAGQRKPLHPAPPATSGHDHRHHKREWKQHHESPESKIYLCFCRFRSPKIPRKHQTTPKIYSLLPLLAENLPLLAENWRPERMKAGDKIGADAICRTGIKEGTPPPFAERQVPFIPIIFRAIKVEKKFAPRKHNFSHRKYSKKSACLWLEKFSEIFYGRMFRGKRNAPTRRGSGQG